MYNWLQRKVLLVAFDLCEQVRMYYAGSIATGNSHITASVSALIWYGQSSV